MRGKVRWLAVVGLLVAPIARVAAQPAGRGSPFRYVVHGYLAQYSLDDRLAPGKQNLGGFGLRLGFNPPDPDRPTRGILDRAQGSLFATYTAKQGNPDMTTVHVGVATDFSLLPRPAGGHLDPFFGLGLGVFITSVEPVLQGTDRVKRSDLAVTPGVGLRVPFFNGIGARGDVRAPLVFGASTTANVVAEAGLYFSF